MRALVAWRGGLFLTEGKIVVLSVSSLFLSTRGRRVAYLRAYTHGARARSMCEKRNAPVLSH